MSRFGNPFVGIGPEGRPVDRFGQPQFVDPNSDLFRQLFGTPNPNTSNPAFPGPLAAPPGPSFPPENLVRPGTPHTELNRVGFGPRTQSGPNQGAGVEGATLPSFFFSQGQPGPPPGPLSNRDFLAADPSRTVGAGSLSGIEGLLSRLFAGTGGGGGGLNLGQFNQSLAARGASAEADLRAEADAQRLSLRQDLARRGILSSGLAAGAEADISGNLIRGLGASRAGILGAGAQADLASQQLGANQQLEQRRMLLQLLQSIPGLGQLLGGLA